MGVARRTDSWREWCLGTTEPPGPPDFGPSIHRPGLPPSCLGIYNPILLWGKCVETGLEAGKSVGERITLIFMA